MEHIDIVLGRLAARQLGLVTRRQLLARGVSAGQIDRRARAGHLVTIYQGVFRIAACPVVTNQALLAACLAAGPGAVASHRAAAGLWAMRGVEHPPVEVLAPRRHSHLPGVIVHRSRDLAPADITMRSGVTVTRPARTLFDLASVVRPPVLEAAVDDALLRRIVTFEQLVHTHERLAGRGRTGSAALRQILTARDPSRSPTESMLEVVILRAMRTGGLPDPVCQYSVSDAGRSFRVDLAYPNVKLAIEGDSVLWHSARVDLERNAVKRNTLLRLGWRVLSFTWSDATRRPEYLVSAVRRELRRRQAA